VPMMPAISSTMANNMVKLCVETPILQMQEESKEAMVHLAFDQSPELLCFTTELNSDLGEPKSDALVGPDVDLWKAAISNEIMNFLHCNAWKKVPMTQVQNEGYKPVPTKMVFKTIQKNGMQRCKAQIMTKSFMMIPYTESFSP